MAITGERMSASSEQAGAACPRMPNSIGRRLVLATLGFCLVFAVVTGGARSWFAWQAHQESMREELALVDQVFQATLSKAIWDMDTDALESQLDSVIRAAPIGRVKLRIFQPGRAPTLMIRDQPGTPPTRPFLRLQRELTFSPYPGSIQHMGTLELDGNEALLHERLAREMLSIVITQVIQALLLAGLIMWMFNRSVTVHVRRIARHLGRLSPENLDHVLHLERPASLRDELTQLEAGVNDVQAKLALHLAQQRQYEQDLSAHRDHLAELVEARTEALISATARLEELSRSDPLTGLANRRDFDEVKETEFRRALRANQPLCVLICDIDFFKRYNDHYGHPRGDRCLQEIAQLLKTAFGRAGELVARLGGEEFAVLLPGVDRTQASEAAGRLLALLADRAIPHAASTVAPYVTLSVGIAELDPRSVDHFDQLLNQADQALYRAKQAGRNQVAW